MICFERPRVGVGIICVEILPSASAAGSCAGVGNVPDDKGNKLGSQATGQTGFLQPCSGNRIKLIQFIKSCSAYCALACQNISFSIKGKTLSITPVWPGKSGGW